VLILAGVHALFPRFENATPKYRHIWVPFSGGVAIGYVFLYMFPKLSDYTAGIISADSRTWEFSHYRLYLFCLAGFVLYYIIDRYGVRHRVPEYYQVLVHSIGFIFYSLLVGYVIANIPRAGNLPLALGTVAIGIHMLGIDHQVRHWHQTAFDRYLRWLFATTLAIGWAIGVYTELPKEVLMIGTAFLAGGIVTNAMTEELPDKEKGNLLPFLAGITFLLIIAVAIRSLPRVYA